MISQLQSSSPLLEKSARILMTGSGRKEGPTLFETHNKLTWQKPERLQGISRAGFKFDVPKHSELESVCGIAQGDGNSTLEWRRLSERSQINGAL